MKNYLLIFTLFLCGAGLYGQGGKNILPNQNLQQERLISDFTKRINNIANSKASTEIKAFHVRSSISDYLRSSDNVANELVVVQYVEKMNADSKIDQDLVSDYVAKMAAAYPARKQVPYSFVQQLGNIKTDRNLIAAYELYQLVGDGLASKDLCKKGNCDFADTATTKTRGAVPMQWAYTGEKKFVRTREYSGYLYRCVMVHNDADTRVRNTSLAAAPNMDSKSKDMQSDLEYAWKRAERVDVWNNLR